jgi:predicted ATPase
MIYIKTIKFLSNYRCFKKGREIVFRDGINVIVGDQGSGKSTLLHCFLDNDAPDIYKIDHQGEPNFMFFDAEKDNPGVVNLDDARDGMSMMQSRFESHGETILPIILASERMKDRLIFLDEPESGLSIRSQLKVADAFKKSAANGCQLIVCTHSQFIMETVDEVYSLEHKKWMTTSKFIETQKQN